MLTSGAFGYPADYLLWWLLFLSLLIHTWCFFRFFPRQRFRKTGLLAGNGLVFLCMLGVAALIGETYYRFIAVRTDAFGMSLPARRWFVLHTTLNSLGCRDVEWTREKPDGVRRIAFIGDSFTYGWGIENVADRFTERLQARFDAVDPGTVEVMNVSKPGWDTSAEFQPLRDMIDVYHVDEVVLAYVANDIEKLLPVTDDFDPKRPPFPKLFNPDSSCLLDQLWRTLWLPRVASVRGYHDWLADGFADPAIWRRHQQQLSAMHRYCVEKGVTFRVVILPFLRTSGERFQPKQIYAHLEAFFRANGIDVLNVYEKMPKIDPGDWVVNYQDPHPNERAHAFFADVIGRTFYDLPAP